MPVIHFDSSFESSYKTLVKKNPLLKKKIKKALLLFGQDTKHPSLNTEKLIGSDIWSIRIDLRYRMFFVWSEDNLTAIFFLFGKHDLYRKI